MQIEKMIELLQQLQKAHPNAELYFVDGNRGEWFETNFIRFGIDEEENKIEMLFDTEE
jgi:hypothetical protein